MKWDLLHIGIADNWTLNVEVGVIFTGIILLLVIISLLVKFCWTRNLFSHDTELDIRLGGIGNVKIKSNHDVAQIAHKAWTELITRKAGLTFDEEHDLIFEVYDSWYKLFSEMRNLIKEIPANRLNDQNTAQLVNILVDSLNNGLRPHLTQWQAKFRRWYKKEIEKPENADKTPQEIQKRYPLYNELSKDLLRINEQIVSYTSELKKLIS